MTRRGTEAEFFVGHEIIHAVRSPRIRGVPGCLLATRRSARAIGQRAGAFRVEQGTRGECGSRGHERYADHPIHAKPGEEIKTRIWNERGGR